MFGSVGDDREKCSCEAAEKRESEEEEEDKMRKKRNDERWRTLGI